MEYKFTDYFENEVIRKHPYIQKERGIQALKGAPLQEKRN